MRRWEFGRLRIREFFALTRAERIRATREDLRIAVPVAAILQCLGAKIRAKDLIATGDPGLLRAQEFGSWGDEHWTDESDGGDD